MEEFANRMTESGRVYPLAVASIVRGADLAAVDGTVPFLRPGGAVLAGDII